MLLDVEPYPTLDIY